MVATYKTTLSRPHETPRGLQLPDSPLPAWITQDAGMVGLAAFVGLTSVLLAVNLLLAVL